jgi:hypothetical protein
MSRDLLAWFTGQKWLYTFHVAKLAVQPRKVE